MSARRTILFVVLVTAFLLFMAYAAAAKATTGTLGSGVGALASGIVPAASGGSPVSATGRLPMALQTAAAVRLAPMTMGRAEKLRPSSSKDPRAYARSRLSPEQYRCLDLLWTQESHWSVSELNRSSGAYGIPQAVPGSKMASAGADWRTNGITQVRWGLGYIHARYGTPCSAWAHSRRFNWY